MSEFAAPQTLNEPAATQTQPSQNSFKKWAGLVVLSLGLAIVIIDTTLLNVSLETIIKDLNTDLISIQWVITLYALILAGFTITGGRLGDLFGRKRMFMLGAIIFAVGSFLASVSHNIPMLLLGESIIEGFGAALMMPATASLVVANFRGKERAMAFGIWGAVAGASSAIGPLLGGYLTSHYSWRWGFRINVFVAALVIIGSLLFIKESRDENKPELDFTGVALSSVGLLALVFGIIESTTYGWLKAKSVFSLGGFAFDLHGISIVPVAILLGLLLLGVFVWRESRVEKTGHSPLVSLSLFKNRQFTAGVITISLLSLGMTGMVFALPIFFQAVKGLDAFHTGLAMLPLSLAVLVTAPLVGSLSKKVEPRYFIQAGLLINILASFIIRATLKSDVTLTALIPGLALYGLGMGMVFAPISNVILSAVPVSMAGEASGVNNTMRQVGGSLGAAIVGAAILTSLTLHLTKAVNASPNLPVAVKQQLVQAVNNPKADVAFNPNFQTPPGTPAIISNEIKQLVSASATQSTKDAYIYAALFAFIGFIVSLFLPKMHEANEKENPLPKGLIAGGIAAIILAITGAVLLLKQSSRQILASDIKPEVSIQDIRSIFAPLPSPIPLPTHKTTPTPTPTPTKTTAAGVSARGEVAGASTLVPASQTFRQDALGFALTLTGPWQTVAQTATSFAVANAAGQIINIQVFADTSATFSSLKDQLSGSDSVSGLTSTSFNNLPALSFWAQGLPALAFIHNGRVYYIFGTHYFSPQNFLLY